MTKLQEENEWMCDYCGVLIGDRRLRRRVDQVFQGMPTTLDACFVCDMIMGLNGNRNTKQIESRQQLIRDVFPGRDPPLRLPHAGTYITSTGRWDTRARGEYK